MSITQTLRPYRLDSATIEKHSGPMRDRMKRKHRRIHQGPRRLVAEHRARTSRRSQPILECTVLQGAPARGRGMDAVTAEKIGRRPQAQIEPAEPAGVGTSAAAAG